MRRFTTKLMRPSVRRFWILVLAGLPLIPCQAAWAQCTSALLDGDFEEQRDGVLRGPWIAEGRAGNDINLGKSQDGRNNAWAFGNTGWNAIRQTVVLAEGSTYTLEGFVLTSGNVRDGYFGFRDVAQVPVSEIKYGPLHGYHKLSVQFRPGRSGTYNVFSGFWAPNQDSWIRIDELRLYGPCEDTVSIPAED